MIYYGNNGEVRKAQEGVGTEGEDPRWTAAKARIAEVKARKEKELISSGTNGWMPKFMDVSDFEESSDGGADANAKAYAESKEEARLDLLNEDFKDTQNSFLMNLPGSVAPWGFGAETVIKGTPLLVKGVLGWFAKKGLTKAGGMAVREGGQQLLGAGERGIVNVATQNVLPITQGITAKKATQNVAQKVVSNAIAVGKKGAPKVKKGVEGAYDFYDGFMSIGDDGVKVGPVNMSNMVNKANGMGSTSPNITITQAMADRVAPAAIKRAPPVQTHYRYLNEDVGDEIISSVEDPRRFNKSKIKTWI